MESTTHYHGVYIHMYMYTRVQGFGSVWLRVQGFWSLEHGVWGRAKSYKGDSLENPSPPLSQQNDLLTCLEFRFGITKQYLVVDPDSSAQLDVMANNFTCSF